MLAKQLKSSKLKDKLPRLICKYPSEFDQGKLEERYGHVKEEDEFKTNQKNWDQFQAHIKALTRTDLPKEYKEDAQWHVHPVAFIQLMKKCGWMDRSDLATVISAAPVLGRNRAEALRLPMNQVLRKYLISGNALRLAHLLAQVGHETGWWQNRIELGNARYFRTMYEIITLTEAGEDYDDNPNGIAWRTGVTKRKVNGVNVTYTRQEYTKIRPPQVQTKAENLGNTSTGDGPRFKGRGFLQITGRKNYASYGTYRGRDFTTDPNSDLLATVDYNACDVSGFFWAREKINAEADIGSSNYEITRVGGIINRGAANKTPLNNDERMTFFRSIYEKF